MSSHEEFAHLKIPLKDIVEATGNFAKENLIGEGGFGKVYKGNLLLSGKPTIIAARRLHYDYGQGDLEFWNEISMFDSLKLKHDNLVSFIGFCNENNEKIVIYKHEINESLDKYVNSKTLTWIQRLKICVGVAQALNYIHCDDGHESSVIHRNIKSSKILLDENWEPKLSGFGHFKSNTKARRHRLVLADIVGTIGYVDPTYEKTGLMSHKSDVYSFGVVLFEILCGRRAFVLDMQTEQHSPQFAEYLYTGSKLKESVPSIGMKPDSSKPSSVGERPPSLSNVKPSSFDGPPSFGSVWSGVDVRPSMRSSSSSLSSIVGRKPPSCVDVEPSSFGGPPSIGRNPSFGSPENEEHTSNISPRSRQKPVSTSKDDINTEHASIISPPMASPANAPVQIEKSYSSTDLRFRLHPFFTMKRLDQYLHTPNEELLAPIAKSHYDNDNLDDIIDPALRKQMDPKSFKLFVDTAYNCLKDKRAERPNIDQILRNLKKALDLQTSYENPWESIVSGEVEGTTSNRWKDGRFEHLKIPLSDIKAATKNFTQTYLGSGTFATVYRAELEVSVKEKTTGEIARKWRTVAIKCIKEVEQAKEGFDAEIELLTNCDHQNIVALLGFCDEGSNMILVYEYASNRSVADYLGSTDMATNLTWMQRVKIAIGIAQGLNYIHNLVEDEQRRIIHRDIKSENILLGKNWMAKIADFGLSRFYVADKKENGNEKTAITNNIAGTNYYMCPEYKKDRKLKTAVDIYSLGVVLFEIVSGKLAYDSTYDEGNNEGIAGVARRRFKDGTQNEMVDHKIMEEVDELTFSLHKGPNKDSLKTYLEIAHRCVAVTQNIRPTAKEIIEELQKALSSQENNKDTLQMSLEEIKLATQNFSRENQIGGGGFGNVYKGEVTRGNESTTIVAKRLDRSGDQGELQFLMELEILLECKHKNIIGLEGYCNENNEKIIVYEYASNRSLDTYLSNTSVTWTKRLKICIEIAEGLAFLHGGAQAKEMIIHRDIKSANILLNAELKAKISDFGLAAITTINQEVVDKVVGTLGYIDPVYKTKGVFSEKSDIYSLGVVLFEILYGRLIVPDIETYDKRRVTRILEQIHEEDKLGSIVFEDIKEQIDPQSLSTFRVIVSKCLQIERRKRPTAEQVLQELKKSLEFQWFSLGSNGEGNVMISATTFSYMNQSPHDMWCIVPESRFQKVAKMLDVSDLMIKIKTKSHLLYPNTIYGVYLIFKFCDSGNVSKNPMYVDLKYRKGSKTLHAYFAKWRDDSWMMIELYRFMNQKEDVMFKFLLESLSHCRDDAIYIEGIEFRVVDNVRHDETEKPKEIKQVMKSNLNAGQELQLAIESEQIFKRFENYDEGEKLFSVSEVNGKKQLMLSAKAALPNFSNLKFFKPLADSRFQEVFQLLPQLMFRISCTIKSQMLSQDTEYMCYLVFKLSEKCRGLHCPVEVRDLLHKNRGPEIVYLRYPRPWNIHDISRVPKHRIDEWMEVNVWKFNSNHELKNDCVLVNLKFISYEGSMSGLIVCGLEFRPM